MKLAKELRREYAYKLEDRNELLDKLRSGSSMTREERDASWVALSDLASCLSRQHYGRKQWCPKDTWYLPPNPQEEREYAKHTERMLVILEFIKAYPDDINLVISRLKARVSWIELVVEARSLGISLELGDVKKAHTQPTIRDIVTASRIHKKIGLDKPIKEVINEYAYINYKTTGKFPTYQRLSLLASRYYKYTQSRSITTAVLSAELPENFFENVEADTKQTWT